jgi:hypothetical protein
MLVVHVHVLTEVYRDDDASAAHDRDEGWSGGAP